MLYGARLPTAAPTTPRFEFGATVINRPEATVSLSLRTQPHAYPHQTDSKSTTVIHPPSSVKKGKQRQQQQDDGTPARCVSRPSSAYSVGSRRSGPVSRPINDDFQFTDRYLPRPYSAVPAMTQMWNQVSALPLPPSDTFEIDDEVKTSYRRPPAAYYQSSSEPVLPPTGSSLSTPFQPALNTANAVKPRLNPSREDLRQHTFMDTPAYFSFLNDQEQKEEIERIETREKAIAAQLGRKRRYATAPSPKEFIPTIPLPARYATSTSNLTASSTTNASSASIHAPALSTVRLASALGLHERSLDVMQVLSQLKNSLDTNFEIIRIDEKEQRRKDENQRQLKLKMEQEQKNKEKLAINSGQPMMYIQAGHVSIPNTPNVTSTTLALLSASPRSNRISSSPVAFNLPQTPGTSVPSNQSLQSQSSSLSTSNAPTFLTDSEIESHALSNFSAAERKKLFGGEYAINPNDTNSTTQKEQPFNRLDLDHDPDEHPPGRPKPPRVGAKRPGPTTELPDSIEYTPEMMLAFEESVRNWAQFLLESQSTAYAHPTDPTINPNQDLILLLLDISAKYTTLMRMAMNPNQEHIHVLLPRMMESIWKVMMVVLETALVRKSHGPSPDQLSSLATANQMDASLNTKSPDSTSSESAPTTSIVDSAAQQSLQLVPIPEQTPTTNSQLIATHRPNHSFAANPLTVIPTSGDHILTNQTVQKTLAQLHAPNFNPSNLQHLTLFQSFLTQYDEELQRLNEAEQPKQLISAKSGQKKIASPKSTSDSVSTSTAYATKDLLHGLQLRLSEESNLKDIGLYSVGLVLQRDSLLRASETLLRENEYLKLNLKQAYQQINWLKENQEVEIRALAQQGEDTVGIALDELDDWLEDGLDLRQSHLQSMNKISNFAYEWTNRHAASVTAEVSAEASHKESMETIRRLNAREADLNQQREKELQEKQAAADALATEKSKAFAVMDREVSSVETLTDEEIVRKIEGITDLDTLRGMIHKLLYTKVKRHLLRETPEQRIIRLKKENTPKLLKTVLLRGRVEDDGPQRLIGLKQLCRQIMEIYLQKICLNATEDAASNLDPTNISLIDVLPYSRRPNTFSAYTYDYFLQKYGLKKMAERNFSELLRSVLVFLQPDRPSYALQYGTFLSLNTDAMLDKNSRLRLVYFARLLHLFTEHPIGNDALEFFLFALKVIQEACAQSVPSSFNKDTNYAVQDGSKNMLRSLELASVPINMAGLPTKRTSKRLSNPPGTITRDSSPTRSKAASSADDFESGSLSFYVPLFLVIESMAYTFRQLGYTDAMMDVVLCQIEQLYIYPANVRSAGTDMTRMQLLLKQVIVRQMIRTVGVGSILAFDKFDSPDHNGIITFEKLRQHIDMDKDTAYTLCSMMDPESGYLGPIGGITQADFTQALLPEYRLCVSLDQVLELTTTAWMGEYQQVTEQYKNAFASNDPSNLGLINFVEFYLLIQRLDPLKTRSQAMRLFKEGLDIEGRVKSAKLAADEAAALAEKKKGSKKKNKSIPIVPKPALTGVGANPPQPNTIARLEEEGKPATDESAAPAATPALSTPEPSMTSPGKPSQRSVKFAGGNVPPTDSVLSPGPPSTSTSKPTFTRSLSIKDTDFVSLEIVLSLLRRNRIGLPPRKPFQEFRAFFRRHRPIQVSIPPKEEIQHQIVEPILASEGITSIPE